MNILQNSWPISAVDTDDFNLKEGKEKVLCVSTWHDNESRRWFKIDPRIDSENSEIPPTRPTSKADALRVPSVAFVESNIYVIGGGKKFSYVFGGQVDVYNIKTGTWSETFPLNRPRAFSFVFVTGRKIYVFGTSFYRRKYLPVPIEDWVECYDLDSPGWKAFSGPKIDEETTDLFFRGPLYAAVLYQDEIRLWGPCTAGIFAFSLSSKTWSFTKAEQVQFLRDDGKSPTPCFNFMSNHAVLGHLVLWQYMGTLYSWDLNDNTTKELCNLEGVSFPAPDPFDCIDYHPGPSKFLHLGNGLLCFIRWKIGSHGETQISCSNFQIDEMLPKGGVRLHATGSHLYRLPGYGIEHAIALSTDCVGSTEDASFSDED